MNKHNIIFSLTFQFPSIKETDKTKQMFLANNVFKYKKIQTIIKCYPDMNTTYFIIDFNFEKYLIKNIFKIQNKLEKHLEKIYNLIKGE